MARKRRLLVPGAREKLEKLKAHVISRRLGRPVSTERAKFEVADQLGIPLSRGDNGELKTKNAGRIGGEIGGQMVKELVRLAQEKIAKKK